MLKTSPTQRCLALLLVSVFSVSPSWAESPYPESTVVATRGTATVTMLDFDAALIGLAPAQRANFMNSPKRIEELIDRLLINRQMANEARTKKLDQDPAFRRAVDQQSDRLLTDQFAFALRADMPLGDVDQLAKERYDVNPDAYSIPGRTEVRHILIDTKTRSDAEAAALAKTVREQAVAGADFIELVKKYSDDHSKDSNEGLIADGESDGLVPEFITGVKGLTEKGEISPLIKTPFGYHIIKLIDRVPASKRSFAQVKERIVTELTNSMRDARTKQYIDELKGLELKAEPEIVASLRTRYLPQDSAAGSKPDSK